MTDLIARSWHTVLNLAVEHPVTTTLIAAVVIAAAALASNKPANH